MCWTSQGAQALNDALHKELSSLRARLVQQQAEPLGRGEGAQQPGANLLVASSSWPPPWQPPPSFPAQASAAGAVAAVPCACRSRGVAQGASAPQSACLQMGAPPASPPDVCLWPGAWPPAAAAQEPGRREAEARMAHLLERLQSRDASAKKHKVNRGGLMFSHL